MWRRLLRGVPAVAGVLLAVSMISFALVAFLPGDLALVMLGDSATPETLAIARRELGLDRPLHERYLQWLGNALQGDFGRSLRSGEPVTEAILARLPVTLELMLLTITLALLLSIPLGVWTAYRREGWIDRVAMSLSLVFLSMPSFLMGVLLVYFVALQLQWLPATGFIPIGESLAGNLQLMVLPVLALALHDVPIYLRVLRSEMIQTLQQNFILLARGMGLPVATILVRNALRPASLNLVTTVGLTIGRLLGGALTIEVLFGLPGLGQLLVESVYQKEYQMMQAIVLFVAIGFVAINLLVDLLYVLLDPRLRDDRMAS
ncbi:ABC transporter permease [Cupriavidus respiraculi]|uniref:ABC transporter permease n=1 Tax=Cupriavidus respiraculi TaxID=195930 RepID=UPI001C943799|nr:ABC transporter permease [Cupriavidus respiraculi]MBY4947708.1 ABC transporter permease [Cupriavidus respiraculi]